MLWLSGAFGALSGLVGSGFSALMANLPAGAVIVLTAAAVFGFSLFFGTARGLVRISVERRRLRQKIARENVLRELYEWFESRSGCLYIEEEQAAKCGGPDFRRLLRLRSWTRRQLRRSLRRMHAQGLIRIDAGGGFLFSAQGLQAAREVVRKHRLWEAYLIAHADIAPGQVDWGADQIEHVLDREMIAKLEKMVPETEALKFPPSPHELKITGDTASP
jgi:manganese/zinc/iron transport system permease protein